MAAAHATETALVSEWGLPEPLPPEEDLRAFAIRREGPRTVAESREMAASDPIALALFDVAGVAEVVLGSGVALVRLGRLFRWSDVQNDVARALPLPTGLPTSPPGS